MRTQIFISIITLAAILTAHPGRAQAATCTFIATGVDNRVYGFIKATGVAVKKKKACARAEKKCNRRLQRARKNGHVPGGRSTQCRRVN